MRSQRRSTASVRFAEEQNRILKLIVGGAPLSEVLEAIACAIEGQADGLLCSLLLLDSETGQLRHGAAPSLPGSYTHAIDGTAIGPAVGSCGTAAYRKAAVEVSDIAVDPLWDDFRDLALAHDLRACWSTPILTGDGRVLGTFAMYYREPRHPTDADRRLIAAATDLASLAIERMRTETALRANEARLQLLARATNDAIWDWDLTTDALWWNDGVTAIFGHPAEQVGADVSWWYEQVHPEDRARVLDALHAVIDDGSASWSDEYRFRRADGSYATVIDRGSVIRDADGIPKRVMSGMQDITERKRLEEALRWQAFNDTLTGLPNRALFLDRLGQALADRDGTAGYHGVIFLDLDGFKLINDSLGHPAGDALLRIVCQRLSHIVTPADTVARFGGDEFAVLLTRLTTPADAALMAERLLAALRAPVVLEGRETFITASVGVAIVRPGASGTTPEDVLRQVDIALYQAKAAGKNRFVVFDTAMEVAAARRLELVSDLHRALTRGEFVLHYQPEVDLATRAIVGVEALVRWQHPWHGWIMPDDFIPVAEETGLILQLGEWVLRTACRQLYRWTAEGASGLVLGINLAAREFLCPTLVDSVAEVLTETGVPPSTVRLEITETTLMEDVDTTRHTHQQLRGLGVQLALDDFGTGYSSLSYLRRLPVDVLKVDRSFVAEVASDPTTRAIVRAVVALARQLGIEVTAEGIETPEQLAALRGVRCRRGQGYLFAAPLPAEAVGVLLRSGLPGAMRRAAAPAAPAAGARAGAPAGRRRTAFGVRPGNRPLRPLPPAANAG